LEIKILTNGTADQTTVEVNGKKLDGLLEFHFSMNPNRKKRISNDKFIDLKGRCKMCQGFNRDYRSYFFEDFNKLDQAMKGGN